MPSLSRGSGIRISFDGSQVYRMANRVRSALDGPTRERLMNRIATVIYSVSQDAFKKQSDPVSGAKWKPLAPWWRDWKGKLGRYSKRKGQAFSTLILHMRGTMSRSGRQVSGKNYARVVYADWKSSLHQEGLYNLRGGIGGSGGATAWKIPQRRFLGLSSQDRNHIIGMIDQTFREAAKG